MARFRASKFKRLVAVLVAAFDFHSGGLSRGHLGIRRRWISARFTSNFASTPSRLLPGFESSCRLPIPSRRELRISNFEPSTSNFSPPNFKSSGKLLVDDLSDCSQLRIPAATSRRIRISSRQRRIQSPANFKSSELRLKFDSIRDRE